MQSLGIVLFSIFAAAGYGIIHDQFTARICVEYFTIGHPPLFNTENPTLLGLGWGVVATWWVGLILGVPLAVAARAGNRPKRSVRSLVQPVVLLLCTMAVSATAAGIIGMELARAGRVILTGPLAQSVPSTRHVAFMADAWAHSASYAVGFLGGIVVIVSVWGSRKKDSERNGAPVID